MMNLPNIPAPLHLECDFCRATPEALWFFAVGAFHFTIAGKQFAYPIEPWGACDRCYKSIEARDLTNLIAATNPQDPLQVYASTKLCTGVLECLMDKPAPIYSSVRLRFEDDTWFEPTGPPEDHTGVWIPGAPPGKEV